MRFVFSPTDIRVFSHRYSCFLPPIFVFSPTDSPANPWGRRAKRAQKGLKGLKGLKGKKGGWKIPPFFESKKARPKRGGHAALRRLGARSGCPLARAARLE